MGVKVVGVYLAAGNSQRMGQNKLALPWKGKPLGSYGLQTAIQSQLEKIIVVFNEGINNDWAKQWMAHKKLHPVTSPYENDGQAASIRCGVKEACKMKADGVIIQLADQPHVQRVVLDGLILRFKLAMRKSQPADYIGYRVEQMVRPPILFGKPLFSSLLKLEGDQGARKLIIEGHWKGIHIAWPNALPFVDVDTWEEYQNLIGHE